MQSDSRLHLSANFAVQHPLSVVQKLPDTSWDYTLPIITALTKTWQHYYTFGPKMAHESSLS